MSIDDLSDKSKTYDYRKPIMLGYDGCQFLRPGDRILYRQKDSSANPFFIDAVYLGNRTRPCLPAEIEKALEEGGMSHVIRLLAPLVGKGLNIPANTIMATSARELFWDETKPLPADRLADFISRNRPDSP